MPFDPNPALPADVRSGPTLREFAEWVGRQDASRPYDYCDARQCALARFGRERGYPHLVDSASGGATAFGGKAYDALNSGLAAENTYGQLAARLEALSESPAS